MHAGGRRRPRVPAGTDPDTKWFMARVRVQHWKESEAQPLLRALRAAGHQVDYTHEPQSNVRYIRDTQPEAIVIDLSRSPAHGRELAVYLRGTKSTRHIPIIFVDGEPEKVQKIRDLIPDAEYTTLAKVAALVKRAIAKPPAAPVVPPQMMERSASRTTAQKMGIAANSRVALIDPPGRLHPRTRRTSARRVSGRRPTRSFACHGMVRSRPRRVRPSVAEEAKSGLAE